MSYGSGVTAARGFLRKFSILLKSARMYGVGHKRTAELLDAAWNTLRAALPSEREPGLTLAVSGSQLLLDGDLLKVTPAERGLAEMLSSAGLASIHFPFRVVREDFVRFVHAFATVGAKPDLPREQLKAALGEDHRCAIRVNEIRFVAEDAGHAKGRVASQLVPSALGADAGQLQAWLTEPTKLLQLITAGQGARSAPAAPQGPAGSAGGAPFAAEDDAGLVVLRFLTHLFRASREPGASAGTLEQHLARMPARAQETLQQTLAELAAAAPTTQANTPMLLRLGEQLAIHFALDYFQRGEVRAGQEMLGRMSKEIDALRETLGTQVGEMPRPGVAVTCHAESFARQFWSALPETVKRSVLLSRETWCMPPWNVRLCVEQLLEQGYLQAAGHILRNYAGCVSASDLEPRRKTAIGLEELADLYSRPAGEALEVAIRHVLEQLDRETNPELKGLLGAALFRLGQEAAERRRYPALRHLLNSLRSLETNHPAWAQGLRARLQVETRLADFVEEALRAPRLPEGLSEVLQQVPQAAAEYLASRLLRCFRRRERDRVVHVAQELGPQASQHLRENLRCRPVAEAVSTVGLLSRLDLASLEELLPARLPDWHPLYQDAVVRQLACAAAPERGDFLVKLLKLLDPLVRPQAIDEIGMSGARTAVPFLVELAGGELPEFRSPFLRVKAIEALGRLREPSAVPLLRWLVEAKHGESWEQPYELRLVAAQVLRKIDPPWAESFLPHDLDAAELALVALDPDPEAPGARQRRYARMKLPHPLSATASTRQGNLQLAIHNLSLGGGLAAGGEPLPPGAQAHVKIYLGLLPVEVKVLIRDVRDLRMPFEIAEMDLEDRANLRRLLASVQSCAS